MKALRTRLLFVGAGLLLGSTLAFAQEKDPNEVGDEPAAGPNCDVTGYKTERIVYPGPVAIPDNVPGGITLGPIFMPPDGDLVNDVILELHANHTWIGDLIIDLIYDPDCNGPAAGIPARTVCRPRGSAANARVPCGSNTSSTAFGCAGDLSANNAYFFSDEASNPIGVGVGCTVTIASGCYRQQDQGGQAYSIWRGLPKGGCWYLNVSDNEGFDTGAVSSWAVWVRNQRPVPATAATWGSMKHLYR